MSFHFRHRQNNITIKGDVHFVVVAFSAIGIECDFVLICLPMSDERKVSNRSCGDINVLLRLCLTFVCPTEKGISSLCRIVYYCALIGVVIIDVICFAAVEIVGCIIDDNVPFCDERDIFKISPNTVLKPVLTKEPTAKGMPSPFGCG